MSIGDSSALLEAETSIQKREMRMFFADEMNVGIEEVAALGHADPEKKGLRQPVFLSAA
jgi:hypothetical protein